MDMDIIDNSSKPEGEEEKGKAIVVILIGAPGSGKSTFCEHVMRASTRPWARICQDTINKGKAGTKQQCLMNATSALKEGNSVFIDRCNLDREQRAEFVKLGGPQVDVHAVVLDLPAQVCISRSVKRTGHEGNLQGGKAAAVVNRMLQKKELPKLNEGFSRITCCQTEREVQAAFNTYSVLGPSDMLPHGFFGQKNPDAKVQLGILKFLKKVEDPTYAGSDANRDQHSVSTQITEEIGSSSKGQETVSPLLGTASNELRASENLATSSVAQNVFSNVPTLAFPSISTADFQFNHEKASDIIVEKVEEFMNKLGNARLVLVDLSKGSKILSLVKSKAAQKIIDSEKFFTFVGDITRLFSEGGLRCNVIANAANWRLKPGGGGVNASIFSAAGPSLEFATNELAKSLLPGNAVVVPLPSTSPLYRKEGVSHVIHVLGPNMNPSRPNWLGNDYVKGCKILSDCYTALFEGFLSIVTNQARLSTGSSENIGSEPSVLQNYSEGDLTKQFSDGDQKIKRNGGHEYEISKKCKGSKDDVGADTIDSMPGKVNANDHKIDGSRSKTWGSWAHALYHIAMHPEKHKDDILEITDDVVVLNDHYPKAQRHILVLARCEGLDCLADVRQEHLQLVMAMHAVGMKWTEKFLRDDTSLFFRLGYHSAPSMRQLHLHVISQDFNSKHLKNKKHWNSFNTAFFRDSVDVIEEIKNHGKATLKDDDSLLSMELRCHRCRSAHPNLPRLKSHISNCSASFPPALLQNGRLSFVQSNRDSEP
ncbi:Macro domain-containing protein/DcpS_C domain-containing protein/AAA_33 domain-containing protein [Cephalotus follicularis]|uniref:Macro domain-containing protein/DcpS_C domain-containing protein/AAA_33 domain-containing protein n=1 Tax=Cephalotus follicularis TaxID=3775 RepID=A0A1Q3C0D2_CEPFO|nr:Macro domain-containing protein/DcpS_C domain-containing protein/AAA_33 domain-containing protein [Cephalotus follicularis]